MTSQRKRLKRQHRVIALMIIIGGFGLFLWMVIGSIIDRSKVSNYSGALSITGTYELPDEHRGTDDGLPSVDYLFFDAPSIGSPWLALVIDDFGPSLNQPVENGFIHLPYNFTFAIISGYKYSRNIAMNAHASGKEVFLHLPMEPEVKVSMNERDMIFCDMNPGKVHLTLNRALADIPNAVGISNHMGSKATADEQLMGVLAEELAQRKLMFVDSRTTNQSVALQSMRAAGVMCAGRNVFLDYDNDAEHIRESLHKLVDRAEHTGWAIGIGHCRKTTLEVLNEELPEIVARGVEIVPVGKLVRKLTERREAIQMSVGLIRE